MERHKRKNVPAFPVLSEERVGGTDKITGGAFILFTSLGYLKKTLGDRPIIRKSE